ncbi:hypothetical protein [Candidatus Cyanaurora vandensis]|uniref:hypothetical protein n=1 Tax=Candidatus Cyanaurora vandensis TaxID=2714958 RepID=UPI00257FBF19|nr:hypothetical protein [Candidatus Cyanaurora vandensis]
MYQEAREEGREEGRVEGEQTGTVRGKLEAVPALLARGFSVEETAQILGLNIEQVQSLQP